MVIQTFRVRQSDEFQLSFPVETFSLGSFVFEITGVNPLDAVINLVDPTGRVIRSCRYKSTSQIAGRFLYPALMLVFGQPERDTFIFLVATESKHPEQRR